MRLPEMCSGTKMRPPNQKDKNTGDGSEHDVLEQNTLDPLTFQLQLPRKHSRQDGWDYRHSGNQEVVVSYLRKVASFGPVCEGIKRDTNDEECNREMN